MQGWIIQLHGGAEISSSYPSLSFQEKKRLFPTSALFVHRCSLWQWTLHTVVALTAAKGEELQGVLCDQVSMLCVALPQWVSKGHLLTGRDQHKQEEILE